MPSFAFDCPCAFFLLSTFACDYSRVQNTQQKAKDAKATQRQKGRTFSLHLCFLLSLCFLLRTFAFDYSTFAFDYASKGKRRKGKRRKGKRQRKGNRRKGKSRPTHNARDPCFPCF
jgi:hypothetical protein